MSKHRHFIIHKPYGIISQFVDNNCEGKALLGDVFDFPQSTMAVGRLDKDSEGLLFITTDGKLSNYIRSSHIEKEYHVQLEGIINEASMAKLRAGVEIYIANTRVKTAPCKVELLANPPQLESLPKRHKKEFPTSWISITIREGRKRQVRKMTGLLGFPTLRLLRVRIGGVYLGDLKPGDMLEVADFGDEISEGYNNFCKES